MFEDWLYETNTNWTSWQKKNYSNMWPLPKIQYNKKKIEINRTWRTKNEGWKMIDEKLKVESKIWRH